MRVCCFVFLLFFWGGGGGGFSEKCHLLNTGRLQSRSQYMFFSNVYRQAVVLPDTGIFYDIIILNVMCTNELLG